MCVSVCETLHGSMTQGAPGRYLNVLLLQTTSQGHSDERLLTLYCFHKLHKSYFRDLVPELSVRACSFKGVCKYQVHVDFFFFFPSPIG